MYDDLRETIFADIATWINQPPIIPINLLRESTLPALSTLCDKFSD